VAMFFGTRPTLLLKESWTFLGMSLGMLEWLSCSSFRETIGVMPFEVYMGLSRKTAMGTLKAMFARTSTQLFPPQTRSLWAYTHNNG